MRYNEKNFNLKMAFSVIFFGKIQLRPEYVGIPVAPRLALKNTIPTRFIEKKIA